ncbi:MAG: aminotransferase class III-fold pyridoxal phosphate-dependent enzyme [Kiloniellales bacterium]|nr:aminotransferase class III-fold pyridoxal phosphate-dependent enzyme [Kiloniellales bacterium]
MIANDRYHESERMLERARRVIPLGTQTFSKSFQQFPQGFAPLFLTHGKGCQVWDVDGNAYIDMISGLLPVVLGYGDPDVDAAIRAQLDRGISFSLATELEIELAERLVKIIPCAEMARFGKNGSDATTACVRIARAATGRERLVICGYHGWHDWYIATTARNRGVPTCLGTLSERVPYNDLDAVRAAFRAHPGEIAALIMEPITASAPQPGYFEELRELVHGEGALMIFDEVITGFRYALGGAQAHFGITPDLAAFGKAMGNGMPISAVVGRADLMAQLEEIFFSATFGGETLSLAAAIAVIDKMRREPVIERLWQSGAELARGIEARIAAHGLEDSVTFSGLAPWTLLGFRDTGTTPKEAIKTLFMREMLGDGVLIAASNNVTYAHGPQDLERVLAAYDRAFDAVARALGRGDLEAKLDCPPIRPVFAVR